MKKYLGITSLALLTPVMALAQSTPQFGNELDTYLAGFMSFLNSTLVPLLFALAFVFFLYGVFKYYFFGVEDESKREEGRSMMLWSIIAFVVMVSIWGIVNLVTAGLGFDNSEELRNVPDTPRQQGGTTIPSGR